MCHAPHGACELKFSFKYKTARKNRSRSPRSVWVEIQPSILTTVLYNGHAPHGACELKFFQSATCSTIYLSRSPRSVWVEIVHCFSYRLSALVTLPTERVSWNVKFNDGDFVNTLSRSPRSVWVEIFLSACYNANTESRSPRSVWVEIHQLQ